MAQQPWLVILGVAILAAAVVIHADWTRNAAPKYALSGVSDDGRTVWRINQITGEVSVCGTLVTGPVISQMEAEREAAVLEIGRSMESGRPVDDVRLSQLVKQTEERASLMRPRCFGWSGK